MVSNAFQCLTAGGKTCGSRRTAFGIFITFVVLAFLTSQWFIGSPAPSAPADKQHPAEGRIAICFFGLVKVIDDELLSTLDEGVLRPLQLAGFTLHSFLHTYEAATFSNAFNKESATSVFNQTQSLGKLRKLLPDTRVIIDPIATPDKLMPLPRFRKAGDPWPFNANESLRYFLRQQFSLLRVTEMWTGGSFVQKLQRGGTVEIPPSLRQRYDAVLYLRPDLYLLSKLNVDAFESIVGASKLAHARLQHASPAALKRQLRHPWLTPIVVPKDPTSPLATPTLPANSTDDEQLTSSLGTTPSSSAMPATAGSTTPLHIAVPTFEWGGLHDRFAFGGPEVMFMYGVRALALGHYIDVLHEPPHAEKYLRNYMCALGAVVHLVPQWTARKRVNGQLEDDGARLWRSKFYMKRVQLWAKWHQMPSIDRYGRGTTRQCMFGSLWSHQPFDAAAKRSTLFKHALN